MGQSYGGYSVMGLVTQTNRFKAGVALAGISDLTGFYYSFDPTARGYAGIEHEKSGNPAIAEVGGAGLAVPPYYDQWLYWRGSPISHVDRIETPLLLIHGEFDVRGSMAQSENLFSALQRQGKPARLLRYWGENHALATSPANVRSVFEETVGWFDRHLKAAHDMPCLRPLRAGFRVSGFGKIRDKADAGLEPRRGPLSTHTGH